MKMKAVLDQVAKTFPKGIKAIFVPFPPGIPTFEGSCERCVYEGTYVLKADYDRLFEENQRLKAGLLDIRDFLRKERKKRQRR